MTRVSVLSALLLAACSVGEVPGPGGGGGGPDAGGTAFQCVTRGAPLQAFQHPAGIGNGNSNAGLPCVSSGCHLDGGQGAPLYQFGGTLYNSDLTTPSAGATVAVTSGGVTKMMVTDDAGNFYLDKGLGFANPFPAVARVTACPTITQMAGNLIVGGGNCNGCHTTGPTAMTAPITLAN